MDIINADLGQTVLYVIQIIGIFSFSLAGAITAMKRGLDAFGVVVMGMTTALGGGLIRDLFMGLVPPSFFTSKGFVISSLITSVLTFLVAYIARGKFQVNLRAINFVNNFFDAVGLGIFVVLGVDSAISHGYIRNAFFCIFLGAVTGVGGGLLRDVMTHAVPFIFKKHIYALAAILGSVTYYYMIIWGLKSYLALILSTLFTFTLRMLATFLEWGLPSVELKEKRKNKFLSGETIRPEKETRIFKNR